MLGNLAVIITVFREPNLRQLQHYVLIACLALSDCAFNALIMPFYIESWWYNQDRHSQALCFYYNYLGTILLQISGTIIVFIAFNRYLLVAHLRLFKKFETLKVTLAQLLVATIMAIVMVAPSFDEVNTSIVYMPQLGRCNFDRAGARIVVYTVFINFVILPFCVIVTLYILVLVHLRRSLKSANEAKLKSNLSSNRLETFNHKSVSITTEPNVITEVSEKASTPQEPKAACKSSLSSPNKIAPALQGNDRLGRRPDNPEYQSKQSKEYQRRLRGFKSLIPIIAVFVVYVITYIPFTVINMVDSNFSLHRNYYMISSLLFWSSSCLNPWIYGIMNNELNLALRRGMLAFLHKFKACCADKDSSTQIAVLEEGRSSTVY